MAECQYDQKTGKIELSYELEKEIIRMLECGDMVSAMKRIMDLTSAGLRHSKEYLDNIHSAQSE